MAATARHRNALILCLSLVLLAGASGRNRENRRLNEDKDDDRRRAAVGRPAADAHRGRERVARGGGALGLLRRRRRLPGLPAAATERVEGHDISRGLLVLPTDESYAYPPTIWRSPPLWTRVID